MVIFGLLLLEVDCVNTTGILKHLRGTYTIKISQIVCAVIIFGIYYLTIMGIYGLRLNKVWINLIQKPKSSLISAMILPTGIRLAVIIFYV